jgi:hypothetical protein
MLRMYLTIMKPIMLFTSKRKYSITELIHSEIIGDGIMQMLV